MGFLIPRAAATAAAAAAASGARNLPDEVDEDGRPIEIPVEALEGDYIWDCEYGFELVVSVSEVVTVISVLRGQVTTCGVQSQLDLAATCDRVTSVRMHCSC